MTSLKFKSGESGASVYFPDASQISAMVGDHSRQMKTQICTVGDVGDGFRSLPIPLNCEAPVSLSSICVQFSIHLAHFPIPAKFNIGKIWDRLLVIIRYIGKNYLKEDHRSYIRNFCSSGTVGKK